jgi:uncharacterized protein YjbI with pentapeptide repeats
MLEQRWRNGTKASMVATDKATSIHCSGNYCSGICTHCMRFSSLFGLDWTGFNGGYNQITTTSTNHGTTTATVKPPGKTLWDWLQLLIIPVVLAVGALLFNFANTRTEQNIAAQLYKQDQLIAAQRYEQDKQIAEKRYEQDQKLVLDKQREDLLQAYLDRMSELLLKDNLRSSEFDAEVRNVARVRTITVLHQLDTRRIGFVFSFLRESGLMSAKSNGSIVNLSNADLIGINFSGVDLREVDLRSANLQNANLFAANGDTNLSNAILFQANLSGTVLMVANLSGAYLQEANLSYAFLMRANLSGADLQKANLSGAMLNGANLKDAKVTDEQLKKAKSLEGATMPDGSIHP